MKKTAKHTSSMFNIKPLATLLLSSWLAGCGGGGSSNDGGDESGGAQGVIVMSGDDTSVFGTQLTIGSARSQAATSMNAEHVVMVDENSSITTEMGLLLPEPGDMNNAFIVIVLRDTGPQTGHGISMTIVHNGAQYMYTCVEHLLADDEANECGAGAIDLDVENRSLELDNARVLDEDTGSELILNGTVYW